VLSSIGGLAGVGVSFLSIDLVASLLGWDAIVTTNSVLLALGISVGVGIVSGLFPAYRASRLDPIAALRHE